MEKTKGKTMKESFEDNFMHFISFTRDKAYEDEGGSGLTILPRDLTNKKAKHIYLKEHFPEHSMGWESYFELENKYAFNNWSSFVSRKTVKFSVTIGTKIPIQDIVDKVGHHLFMDKKIVF